MNEMTKEARFLDAINKYAEQQKAQITQEIEEYKNAKIEQATEQGLQDAYELIRGDIAKRKAAIVKDVSKKERGMREELFAVRSDITKKVFEDAASKLKAFVSTPGYDAFLIRSAEQIAQTFSEGPCVVYMRSEDQAKRDLIKEFFPEGSTFETDPKITIGGVKAYCEKLRVFADDTLDTRLSDQRAWFIAHAGLKVV